MRGQLAQIAAVSPLVLLAACAGVVPGGGPVAAPQLPYGTPVGAPVQPVPPAPSAPMRAPGDMPAVARPIPAVPNPPLPAPPVPGDAANAAAAGVIAAGPVRNIGISPANAAAALAAFRASCPALLRRTDSSGLTRNQDWAAACGAATTWPAASALNFFDTHLTAVQVGDGRAHATGYYEPEMLGSRERRPGFTIPVYRRPPDLVEVDLSLFAADLAERRIRGRLDGDRLVPYHDRAAIETGALAGRGLEIAWVADAPEFFFLQIQGSGRLRLPDGQVMRLGYASQNGHRYVGIGRMLLDRGQLAPGQASMQGIMAYLRADPARGTAVMRENPSYIFFQELTGPGPLGSLNVPVVERVSVATDPRFIPLGAPVFLSMDRAEPNGLWVAQDTGGAIKGANRVDTFWGAGDTAVAIAGGMSARGSALLLLPPVSVARLTAPPAAPTPPRP